MSENPVIDLRQATINAFLTRLDQLTDAIIAGNKRYASLDERMGGIERRLAGIEERLTGVHSEVLSQTNIILTLQRDVLRLLHLRDAPAEG